MFFSVKSALKIADKVYTPCVCYALPEVLEKTVDKLVTEGKAVKYEEQVFFQNGKVLEMKSVEVKIKETKKNKKSKPEFEPEFELEVESEPIDEEKTEVEGF